MSERDESVAERQARLGRNEAIFRIVNERMSELTETFAGASEGEFAIVCECGTVSCAERIVISEAEYARVRSDGRLFVLTPGHEDATVEGVVQADRGTGYLIVRKHHGVPTHLEFEGTAPAAP